MFRTTITAVAISSVWIGVQYIHKARCILIRDFSRISFSHSPFQWIECAKSEKKEYNFKYIRKNTHRLSLDVPMLTLYLEKLHAIFSCKSTAKWAVKKKTYKKNLCLAADVFVVVVVVMIAFVLVWCVSFQHLHSLHKPHFVGSSPFSSASLSHSHVYSLFRANRRYFIARYVFIVIFFGCFVFIRRAAPRRAVKFQFHSLRLCYFFFLVVVVHRRRRRRRQSTLYSLAVLKFHLLSTIFFSAVCKNSLAWSCELNTEASCSAFNSVLIYICWYLVIVGPPCTVFIYSLSY